MQTKDFYIIASDFKNSPVIDFNADDEKGATKTGVVILRRDDVKKVKIYYKDMIKPVIIYEKQ